MEDQQRKWEGLFRGSVLSATLNKHVGYFTSADTRAQGLILLNTALVTLALNGMQNEELRSAALLSVITALFTMTLCIFSLYPKRLPSKRDSENILHYVQFSAMSEVEFLAQMKDVLADRDKLAEAAVRDLYHLGSKIIGPKYMFLRFAYIVFLLGQLTSALWAVAATR